MSDDLARELLVKQFRQLSKDGYSLGLINDNIYNWRLVLEGPPGSFYEGGYFPCKLEFPKEFPNLPPVMTFLTPDMWHPNIYADGKVCISILHKPEHDAMNEQELLSEKWRPILGIEAIIVSVQSMLSEPNINSPANIDASVQYKNDPVQFKRKVKNLVRKSVEQLMNGEI